jgi:hypothetical protein
VRSRISFCAVSGSFQSAGSSALTFSSARRRCEASTSKMPPQQSDGLLNVGFQRKRFGAHGFPKLDSAGGLRPSRRGN